MTTGNDSNPVGSMGSTGLASVIVIGGATLTLLGLSMIVAWTALSENLHILFGALRTLTI